MNGILFFVFPFLHDSLSISIKQEFRQSLGKVGIGVDLLVEFELAWGLAQTLPDQPAPLSGA